MAKLKFISDEKLKSAVMEVLTIAINAKKKAEGAKFGSNIIDPFGLLFEMYGFGIDQNGWMSNEKIRQAQKTLQNSIGSFHQKIIGSFPDWEDLGTGGIVDVVNNKRTIVAEVKNKHNTVKGNNLKEVYDTLSEAVLPKNTKYKDYTGYYVEMIPKKAARYDVEFVPSDNKTGQRRPPHKLIRRIDGYSFYELATGVPHALEKVFQVLPDVIEECLADKKVSAGDRDFTVKFFKTAYEIPPPKEKAKKDKTKG